MESKSLWIRLVLRLLLPAALVLAGLLYFGTRPASADFTLSAETGILRLHTYCAQQLVWDLPPGVVKQQTKLLPDGDPAPDGSPRIPGPDPASAGGQKADGNVSIAMEGNVLVTVSRSPAGPLLVVLQRGENSDSTRPLGTVTVSNEREGTKEMSRESQSIAEKLYYRSVGPAPLDFTLPLWGRVTVGDDVPQGSGSAAGTAPLLHDATIRARVALYRGLNQGVPRRTVIDEPLDAGDIVDTHPKLMHRKMNQESIDDLCKPRREGWAAVGFVAPEPEAGVLKVVVHRKGESMSVTRASSTPFDLSVSRWHLWIANPYVQIGLAFLALLFYLFAVADNLWASIPLWKRAVGINDEARNANEKTQI